MYNYKDEISLKTLMPKEKDIKNMSSFFYAFSDDTRLKVVILLTIKPLCVSEISNVLGFNQTTVSHQLKILKSLNIVDSDRNGKNIFYYIKNNEIENILNVCVDCI